MNTYHFHIGGIVQGVGFRPYVYRMARDKGLVGTVCNATDGVHIIFNCNVDNVDALTRSIINQAPQKAVITYTILEKIEKKVFHEFKIVESHDNQERTVLLTPDYALCKDCQEEVLDVKNRRKGYAFTTCTVCGPRYSILRSLPYDREQTTMSEFSMCPSCQEEYNDVFDRRYYSQTNSCPACAVSLSMLVPANGQLLKDSQEAIINKTVSAWKEGKIIAIKGIGGYLLTCDATNNEIIQKLRILKDRPSKPFAVMYHDFLIMAEDVDVDVKAMMELDSDVAPIVLLPKKKDPWTDIAFEAIAPGLKKVGVMLPYTPLYILLLEKFGKPIIATSGNQSGDPIEYMNAGAVENLKQIADLILHNDRIITTAQDDSVVNITPVKRNRIIMRRSRGMAPTFIPPDSLEINHCILTMGGLLKSTFALSVFGQVYISQYLGDTDSYLTQKNYSRVLDHFLEVFHVKPEAIVCDKHPSFYSSMEGQRLAEMWNLPLYKVQHHIAHFYAVMGEKDLFKDQSSLLGVIWDGTGMGDDGNIWGGEFFIYKDSQVDRISHLPYFQVLAGDKMAKEPRLSALSICLALKIDYQFLAQKFSREEWNIYGKLISGKPSFYCSSMGRLYDAMASILLDCDVQTYEGEAAMYLENCAYEYLSFHMPHMNMSYLRDEMDSESIVKTIVERIIMDKQKDIDVGFISARFHVSLVDYIGRVARQQGVIRCAFSGGVFQNAWLVDLIQILLKKEFDLYFHDLLSPNDENISFGQLMYASHNINL